MKKVLLAIFALATLVRAATVATREPAGLRGHRAIPASRDSAGHGPGPAASAGSAASAERASAGPVGRRASAESVASAELGLEHLD